MGLHKIQFQGHWGVQDLETNKVIFYNITFDTICVAAEYLKKLPAGPQYLGKVDDGTLYFEVREGPAHDCIMEVHRTSSHGYIPRRATEGSAGYELFAAEECTINPGNRVLVTTGISVKIPMGLYGRIASCSGLAIHNGIQVGAGVIDAGHHRELSVLLFNHSQEPFTVQLGSKIAQLILERHEIPEIKII